ncbi:hypothetical protein THRCLA_06818 [Thraustotheca clavata]|uniref:MSP domain-containing protein n=1 Tax=Thraustotheca clavata TaxID=74557 RepID=A0A1V9ZJI2_9STRA|nr:hypothetical protein THRCLA_06818 [Thraustotheca clavata]
MAIAIDIDAPCNSPLAFAPAETLLFVLGESSVKNAEHLTLYNLHPLKPTIFSIKTLNPERYFIKPSKGILNPHEALNVKVELRQALFDEVAFRQTQEKANFVTDRLLVQCGNPLSDNANEVFRESLAFNGKERSSAKDMAWTMAWKTLGPRDLISKSFTMRFEPTSSFAANALNPPLVRSGYSLLSQTSTSAFSVDPIPSEAPSIANAPVLASIQDIHEPTTPKPLSPLPLPKTPAAIARESRVAPMSFEKKPSNDAMNPVPLPSEVVQSNTNRLKADRSGLIVAITPSTDVLTFKISKQQEIGYSDVAIENRCSKCIAYTVRIESKFKCKAVPFKVGWLDGPDKTNVRLEIAPSLNKELLERLLSHDGTPLPQYKIRVQCMELDGEQLTAMTALPSYDKTIDYLKDIWHHQLVSNRKVLVHKFVTSFALDTTVAPVQIERLSDVFQTPTEANGVQDGEGRSSEVSECASFQTAFTRAPPMRPIMTPLEHLQYQRSLNQHLLPRDTIEDFRDTLFDDLVQNPTDNSKSVLEGVKEGEDEDATSSHLSAKMLHLHDLHDNESKHDRPYSVSVENPPRQTPISTPRQRRPSASVGDAPLPISTKKIDLLAPSVPEQPNEFIQVTTAEPEHIRPSIKEAEKAAESDMGSRPSAVRFSLDDVDILAAKYMTTPVKPKYQTTGLDPPPQMPLPIVHPPAPIMLTPLPIVSPRHPTLSPRHDDDEMITSLMSPHVAVTISTFTPRSSIALPPTIEKDDDRSDNSSTVDHAFASFMGPLSPTPVSVDDNAVIVEEPVQQTPEESHDEIADTEIVSVVNLDTLGRSNPMIFGAPSEAPSDSGAEEPVSKENSPILTSKEHTIHDDNSGFSILTFPKDKVAEEAPSSPTPEPQTTNKQGRSFFPKAILKSFQLKDPSEDRSPNAPLELPDEEWMRQNEIEVQEQPPKKMKSFLRKFEKNYSAPTTTTGLISLTPQTIIYHLDVGKKPVGKVTLQNIASHCVAFKIKTAQPQRYKVRPNQGYMEPKTSFAIDINLHQAAYDQLMCCSNVELSDIRDCLIVETIAIPSKKTVQAMKASRDPNSMLKTIWAHTDRKTIHASRLFCEYAFDDSQYHSFSSSNNTGSSFLLKDLSSSGGANRLDRIESMGEMVDNNSDTPPPSPQRAKGKKVLRNEF